MSILKFVVIFVVVMLADIANVANAQQKFVADKVVAVVGNTAVFYSEVEQASRALVTKRLEEGYTSDRDPMCEAIEKLVMEKLLYSQALIDSVKIGEAEIDQAVIRNVEGEVNRLGSIAAVEAFYQKPIFDLRSDLRTKYTIQRYAATMEQTIRDKVVITPGEVEKYFKKIPKDSLPIIPEQYQYSQILKYPPSIEEAKLRTKEKLLELRERISNGTRFDVLARMYSEDPGSASRGGEMDFAPKESYLKPFADALAKLKPDQISDVVETEFGFHIIQLLETKNNLYRCRHILLRPKFTSEETLVSMKMLDSLKTKIEEKAITFAEAATKHSEDKYSRLNKGVVTNLELLQIHNINDAREASTLFLKEDLGNDYQIIRTLKIGDISTSAPSVDGKGNTTSKIIMLNKIVPTHPANLQDDYIRIEYMAKLAKEDKEFDKWLESKIASMYIRIADEFKHCDFEHKSLIK